MKDDIRKYLPDLATVLRETEPARIKERREKAVEGFKDGLGGAPANEVEPESSPRVVQRAEAEAGEATAEAEAVETASPWVKGAPVAVPKEALPSSLAPAAVSAPEAAIPKEAAAVAAGSGHAQKKKWPRWAPAVLAVLAVVVPLVLLWLATRPKAPPEGAGVGSAASAPAVAPSFREEGPAPGESATAAPAAITAAPSATAPEVDAGTPGAALAPRSPSSVRPPRSPAPSSPAQAPTSSASAPKAPENPFDKPNFD